MYPVDDQKRPCFAIAVASNAVTHFYGRTIQDRDEWVKYLARVINNLSEETQVGELKSDNLYLTVLTNYHMV